MSLNPDDMPVLVRDFAEAVRCSPEDQHWLRLHGHALIDSLIEPNGDSKTMALEVLRSMKGTRGCGDTILGKLNEGLVTINRPWNG